MTSTTWCSKTVQNTPEYTAVAILSVQSRYMPHCRRLFVRHVCPMPYQTNTLFIISASTASAHARLFHSICAGWKVPDVRWRRTLRLVVAVLIFLYAYRQSRGLTPCTGTSQMHYGTRYINEGVGQPLDPTVCILHGHRLQYSAWRCTVKRYYWTVEVYMSTDLRD